jgi:hypothetical protein
VIRPAQHIEATLSTLRREAVTMRSVFKHAVRLGYLKASDIPKIDLVAEERNKRPSFTDAEVAKLMEVADQRLTEALLPTPTSKNRRQPNAWTMFWSPRRYRVSWYDPKAFPACLNGCSINVERLVLAQKVLDAASFFDAARSSFFIEAKWSVDEVSCWNLLASENTDVKSCFVVSDIIDW